jgi:hypothetical protein
MPTIAVNSILSVVAFSSRKKMLGDTPNLLGRVITLNPEPLQDPGRFASSPNGLVGAVLGEAYLNSTAMIASTKPFVFVALRVISQIL